MYLMRNVLCRETNDENGKTEWKGTSKASNGEAWAGKWNGPQHILFGHDAMRKLQMHPHATGDYLIVKTPLS